MKNIIISNKTTLVRFLLAGLFVLLVGALSAYEVGDYKTAANNITFTSTQGWQYCSAVDNNGVPTWVGATQVPPSPFEKTMYIGHIVSFASIDFVLEGKMVMYGVPSPASIGKLVLSGSTHLHVTDTANVQLKEIEIQGGTKLTNNGIIQSNANDPGLANIFIASGGTLINNSSISLNAANHSLIMAGGGTLKSGQVASINGSGSISTTGERPIFEIANPGGFCSNGAAADAAISLTGTHSCVKADYLFNGTVAQHTGFLPSLVFSIVVDNPEGLKFDQDVNIHAQAGFVTVKSGATLDMGPFIMKSKKVTEDPAYWQSAVFTLEEGATLKTQHPEGASLEATNGLITKGCIQMNTANYNGQIIVIDDTLPVTLSSFTATIAGPHKVRISWMTASETNCLGYQIWRSNNTDLASAICVTPMIQATNSSQGGYYAFTDTDLYQEGTYYYWLEDISFNYESQFHGYIQLRLEFQGDNHTPEAVERTGFKANYPNPFNPSTTLRYGLSEDSDVTIRFYNQRGQLIDSRQLPNQKKGKHSLVWNAQDLGLSSGIYFARLLSQNGSDTLKITLSE